MWPRVTKCPRFSLLQSSVKPKRRTRRSGGVITLARFPLKRPILFQRRQTCLGAERVGSATTREHTSYNQIWCWLRFKQSRGNSFNNWKKCNHVITVCRTVVGDKLQIEEPGKERSYQGMRAAIKRALRGQRGFGYRRVSM